MGTESDEMKEKKNRAHTRRVLSGLVSGATYLAFQTIVPTNCSPASTKVILYTKLLVIYVGEVKTSLCSSCHIVCEAVYRSRTRRCFICTLFSVNQASF